jgi:hypothetical protein
MAIDPFVGKRPQVAYFLRPFYSLVETNENFVVFIKHGESGIQFRNQHLIMKRVDVGGLGKVWQRFNVLAVELKPLQCVSGSVSNHQRWLCPSGPAVNPESVRGIKLAGIFTGASEATNPTCVLVELVDEKRTIPVGKQETAIIEKRKICGQESFAIPRFLGRNVLAFGVDAGLHGGFLVPDRFASQSHFGKGFDLLISGDVEEFVGPFFSDFDTVAAASELTPESTHELALSVKGEDRRVVFSFFVAFVNNVNVVGRVNGHVVRKVPFKFIWKLSDLMVRPISVLACANNTFSLLPERI